MITSEKLYTVRWALYGDTLPADYRYLFRQDSNDLADLLKMLWHNYSGWFVEFVEVGTSFKS